MGFNPDEERDAQGKWAGSGAADLNAPKPKNTADVKQVDVHVNGNKIATMHVADVKGVHETLDPRNVAWNIQQHGQMDSIIHHGGATTTYSVVRSGEKLKLRKSMTAKLFKDMTAGDVHVATTDRPKGKTKAKLFSTIGDVLMKSSFSISVPISKMEEDKRLVFGWASVIEKNGEQIIDHQGDAISEAELETAFYDFAKNGRQTGEMHEGGGFGDLVECVVFTKQKQEALGIDLKCIGAWVGFRVPPDVFAKIKSGDYAAFSIQGSGVRTPIEGD